MQDNTRICPFPAYRYVNLQICKSVNLQVYSHQRLALDQLVHRRSCWLSPLSTLQHRCWLFSDLVVRSTPLEIVVAIQMHHLAKTANLFTQTHLHAIPLHSLSCLGLLTLQDPLPHSTDLWSARHLRLLHFFALLCTLFVANSRDPQGGD